MSAALEARSLEALETDRAPHYLQGLPHACRDSARKITLASVYGNQYSTPIDGRHRALPWRVRERRGDLMSVLGIGSGLVGLAFVGAYLAPYLSAVLDLAAWLS